MLLQKLLFWSTNITDLVMIFIGMFKEINVHYISNLKLMGLHLYFILIFFFLFIFVDNKETQTFQPLWVQGKSKVSWETWSDDPYLSWITCVLNIHLSVMLWDRLLLNEKHTFYFFWWFQKEWQNICLKLLYRFSDVHYKDFEQLLKTWKLFFSKLPYDLLCIILLCRIVLI